MHIEDRNLVSALSEQTGDDQLLAAVYARFETAASPARWLGPLGNYLIVRPAARAAAHRITEATDVPLDAAVVLGATAADLHVWSADIMLSTVNDHLGSVPLHRITNAASEPGKGWWALTITLDTGETIELSARGDVPALTDALKPTHPPTS